MLRTICKRFGIRISSAKITVTVKKNRLRPGSCSTGFARKLIFKERRKFFSCTIFHAERDFAYFSAVKICSQKNNVFVKNALVRQRCFLANSKAFFFLPSVFLSENKISVNCRNIERIFFSCFFVHG